MDGPVAMGNSDLVAWLEEIQLDQPSIRRVCNGADPLSSRLTHFQVGRPFKCPEFYRLFPFVQFVAEKLTLRDVQDHMTRDDVIDLKLK